MAGGEPDDGEALGAASSREQLLDAALELFSRRGFGDTTVSEVARRAGVSKGLVYHYFDTKRELLAAAMRRGTERVESVLGRHAPAAGPGALAALVMEVLGLVAEDLPYWRLRFALRMRPDLRDELALDRWSRELEEALETGLRASGSGRAAEEARALAAAVDGVAQHYVLDPDGYPIVEVAETVVARYALSG